MTINEIIQPVEKHILEFDKYFKRLMKSRVSLLDTIIQYINKRRGKRIRSSIVFLVSELCGGVNNRTYVGAAMVELLHTATLIHDDVVDEARERRGIASINARWNNKIAVLIGDYLLAKGLLIAVENKEFGFLESLSRTVKRMSEGELLQIQKSKDYNNDEDTYYQIISNKTASLISTCCEIGAMSSSNDTEIHKKMRDFGELVGISFQIRDDIFDFSSKSSILGKPVGNDLKEKKITLPLIYSLSKVNNNESKDILKLIKDKKITKKEISKVIDFVKANEGIEYAEMRAREYIDKAQLILDTFPDSPAKKSLQNLSIFVFERDI